MRISEEQYRQFLGKKTLKYHNNKVVKNGIKYDSQKEYLRHLWLKTLEEEGKITELELQKKFELQESFINNEGKKERPIYYIADFFYYSNELYCYIAEDVKSEATRQDKVYRLKRKMFEYQYPNIVFREVL
jgi:hypothetical protein